MGRLFFFILSLYLGHTGVKRSAHASRTCLGGITLNLLLTLPGVLATGARLTLIFPLGLLLGLLRRVLFGRDYLDTHHLGSFQRDAAQQAGAELVHQYF